MAHHHSSTSCVGTPMLTAVLSPPSHRTDGWLPHKGGWMQIANAASSFFAAIIGRLTSSSPAATLRR
eukprot:4109375-Amphidinium_carterae.3